MNIPGELRSFSQRITVEHTTVLDDDCVGQWRGRESVILLAPGLAEDIEAETFLHELIEHVNAHLELGMEHPQIQAMSVGLFQVMRGNGLDFGKGGHA